MPSISNTGRIAAGSGVIGIDRHLIAQGAGGTGLVRWVDDDTVIYQDVNDKVVQHNVTTDSIEQRETYGANEIAAGGGQSATWLAGVGLRHSRGGLMPNAGLKDVGRDGTLAICPNRQTGIGLNFIALQDDDATRRFMNFETVVAQEVHVVRWGCAVWKNERGEAVALIDGRQIPVPAIAPVFRVRLLSIDGEWWVAYNTNEQPRGRTLFHPVTVTEGFVIADGDAQFGLDALALDNDRVLFTWAGSEGEDPGAGITVAEFNLKSHRLTGAGDDRILAYEKLTRRTTTPPVVIVTPPNPPDPPKPTEKKPMQLTARQQDIVQQLYDRHPEFFQFRGDGEDDERRKGAKLIAQQFCFEFGDEWGWKSNHGNTENDAPSKDAIAKRTGPYTPGSRQDLEMFDLFNGTTRKPNNPCFSETENRNQYFVPVEPVNHLGVPVDPPQPPVDPPVDPPQPDTTVDARLKALEAAVAVFNRNDQVLSADAQATAKAVADLTNRLAAVEVAIKNLGSGSTPGTPASGNATEATLKEILNLLKAVAGKLPLPLAA